MNEWLKKFTASFKERWAKWSVVQKAILGGIIVIVIAAIIITARVAHAPTTVALHNNPITDQARIDTILAKLDAENVSATVSPAGIISVADERTARLVRPILVSEGLLSIADDPYRLFDSTDWAETDYERGIKNLRAIRDTVKQSLSGFEGIARADVAITLPERTTFSDEQEPAKAGVILHFKPGAEKSRKQMQGVQRIVLSAVPGLREEDITITDPSGNVLNDFESDEDFDNISLVEREQKLIAKLEKEYRGKILVALQQIFTADRVRDLNIKIDMSMNKVARQTHEILPTELAPQDPDKPYDTRVYEDKLPVSETTVENVWTGTGYNPEGVAGVEGQNPPVYSDMSNVVGQSTSKSKVTNYEFSYRDVQEEVRPSIDRVTVSVNIDGAWKKKYDKNHNPIVEQTEDGSWEIARTYVPVDDNTLEKATALVQNAIGYNRIRGDSVSVQSIQVYRDQEFEAEDAAYFKAQNTRRVIVWSLAGVVIVLLAFIIFRFISREIERRRRLREEEILRKQQAERERQLWEAKNEGMEVTMSVEERKRAELQENAIAMAKEHPEDVAMLIRTWMMEE